MIKHDAGHGKREPQRQHVAEQATQMIIQGSNRGEDQNNVQRPGMRKLPVHNEPDTTHGPNRTDNQQRRVDPPIMAQGHYNQHRREANDAHHRDVNQQAGVRRHLVKGVDIVEQTVTQPNHQRKADVHKRQPRHIHRQPARHHGLASRPGRQFRLRMMSFFH
ncbi:hypothetical protein D3C80_982930 [compost metagenome]